MLSPVPVPSLSISLITISPAPKSSHLLVHSNNSKLVFILPPFENTTNFFLSNSLKSIPKTTHWDPNFSDANLIKLGFCIASLFRNTLSAPLFKNCSKHSNVFTPPPTVKGIKICSENFFKKLKNSLSLEHCLSSIFKIISSSAN